MPNAADNAKSMMENEMDNSPIKNAYNAVLRVWNPTGAEISETVSVPSFKANEDRKAQTTLRLCLR